MRDLLSTAAPLAPVAAVFAVICAAAWVVVKWWEASKRARVRALAADTLAREQRAAELRAWERHVCTAFEQAMGSRPHLAAIKAAQEAERIDDEWAAMNGGRG